jgi:hypothetical protein
VETASRGLIHAPQDLSQTQQWQVAPAVVAEPASGDLLPTPPDLRTTPLRRPTEAGPTAPSPLAPAEAGPTAPVAAPLPSCRDEVYMRWRVATCVSCRGKAKLLVRGISVWANIEYDHR